MEHRPPSLDGGAVRGDFTQVSGTVELNDKDINAIEDCGEH